MKKVQDNRIALWAHCVSEHAAILPPDAAMGDLEDYHAAEHRGPGTIRNHPPSSREYSLKKLDRVLSEAES